MENEDKRCQACGRLYEVGRNGVCRACQRAKEGVGGQGKLTQRKKHKRLRCDCGKPAVTVKTVRVGEGGVYPARLPLCADCLKVEESYGLDGGTKKSAPLP
jgi:NMD protein affecting ribosome stability and mRNA decay